MKVSCDLANTKLRLKLSTWRSPHVARARRGHDMVSINFTPSTPQTEPTNSDRLVATLGSRSITRRLNRKAILDVDVPGACSVIVNPEAPMALRLQGSLL